MNKLSHMIITGLFLGKINNIIIKYVVIYLLSVIFFIILFFSVASIFLFFGLDINKDLWLAMDLLIIGIVEFIVGLYVINNYLSLNKSMTINLSEIILDKVICITLSFISCIFIYALLTQWYVKVMLNNNIVLYTSQPNYISTMLFLVLWLPNLLFVVVAIIDSKINLINKNIHSAKSIMLNSLKLALYTIIVYTLILCLHLCIIHKSINNDSRSFKVSAGYYIAK